jgi:hypothetical protein
VRDKLNNSPAAQIGLVALLVVAAFVLVIKPGGGGGEPTREEPAPTEATVSVAGTGATGTATAATPGEAVEGAVEGAVEAAGTEGAGTVPTSLPTPPMPAPVASAYDAGRTVVLLVVHDGGVDDRLVAGSVERLRSRPGIALFVVPARNIAHYAAITLGAAVQQVPALLVMRPRALSGGVPQASVDYGFQTPQSVVQAVVDAGYKGPEATYHPN